MTQSDMLNTKTTCSPMKKSIFNMEIFTSEIKMKRNFFKMRKQFWLKMHNMTQRDALIKEKYIFAHKKTSISDRNFLIRKCEKKIL